MRIRIAFLLELILALAVGMGLARANPRGAEYLAAVSTFGWGYLIGQVSGNIFEGFALVVGLATLIERVRDALNQGCQPYHECETLEDISTDLANQVSPAERRNSGEVFRASRISSGQTHSNSQGQDELEEERDADTHVSTPHSRRPNSCRTAMSDELRGTSLILISVYLSSHPSVVPRRASSSSTLPMPRSCNLSTNVNRSFCQSSFGLGRSPGVESRTDRQAQAHEGDGGAVPRVAIHAALDDDPDRCDRGGSRAPRGCGQAIREVPLRPSLSRRGVDPLSPRVRLSSSPSNGECLQVEPASTELGNSHANAPDDDAAVDGRGGDHRAAVGGLGPLAAERALPAAGGLSRPSGEFD